MEETPSPRASGDPSHSTGAEARMREMGDQRISRGHPAASAGGEHGITRALIVGSVAAIVGGIAWAVIVGLTHYELGYAAWGIGLLVGVAMVKATPTRGQSVAVLAALLAALGLMVGKVLIVEVTTRPSLAKEIQADEEWMAQAALYELQANGSLPAEIKTRLDALAFDDTIPDALWADMLAVGSAHAAEAGPEKREAIATTYADMLVSSAGFGDLFQSQMTLWDLLWFGLAVTTAWQLLARGRDEEESAQAQGS